MFCCLNNSGEIRKEIDCISNHSIPNLPEDWTNQWLFKTKHTHNKMNSNKINNPKLEYVALPKHMTTTMSKEEIEQGNFIGELNKQKYHHSLKNLKPYKVNYPDVSTPPHYLDVRELLPGKHTQCISKHNTATIKKTDEYIHDNYELLATSPLTTHESTFDEIYDIGSKFEMIIDKKEINETINIEKQLQNDVPCTSTKKSLSIEIIEPNPIDLKELFSKTSPTFLPFAFKGEFYDNLHKRF